MLIASTPIAWAFTACRTLVHLWMTLIPLSWNMPMCGSGLAPAVSTILMPDSTITRWYSS